MIDLAAIYGYLWIHDNDSRVAGRHAPMFHTQRGPHSLRLV